MEVRKPYVWQPGFRIEGCMHVCGSRPLVELYFPSYGKVDECYENLSG